MVSNTECISKQETISILGINPNSFEYFVKKHDNALRPARREGNTPYYRRCDVVDFKKKLDETPRKTYTKKPKHKQPGDFNKVDNKLLSDALKFKKSLEDRILVLQNTHKQICETVKVLSK